MTIDAKPIQLAKQKAIEWARVAAKLRGCTCHPLIEELRELRPEVFIADLAHVAYCPIAGGTGKACNAA